MLNTEKIRLMTQASLYEEAEQRRDLHVNRYFWGDFVSSRVFRTLIVVTVGFFLAAALWIVYHSEDLLTGATLQDLVLLGRNILLIYAAVFLFYLIVSAVWFYLRYRDARASLKEHAHVLKKIAQTYEKDEPSSGREDRNGR